MIELIYLGIGIVFRAIIVFNHKSYKDQLTYEQVDAKIRADLAVSKHLCTSLKEDVALLKRQLADERAKNAKPC
jgi:hypothetical protein